MLRRPSVVVAEVTTPRVRRASRPSLAARVAAEKAVKGFWIDLVADDRGAATLDRIQIVVWTMVLMAIASYEMVYNLRMPEFSATLLGLMGISSGTYLGFKLPAATA